jgi:translation initiation factor 2 subunit 2
MSDYEEQLEDALSATPDIQGSEARFSIPDPDVRQEGHVTVYENFQSTIDRLDREATSVLKFLQNELGTSAHIDERGRARLTGEFTARRIGDAIEAFADAYVLCPECGLPDTRLETEQDAETIRCTACGAISPAG